MCSLYTCFSHQININKIPIGASSSKGWKGAELNFEWRPKHCSFLLGAIDIRYNSDKIQYSSDMSLAILKTFKLEDIISQTNSNCVCTIFTNMATHQIIRYLNLPTSLHIAKWTSRKPDFIACKTSSSLSFQKHSYFVISSRRWSRANFEASPPPCPSKMPK